MDAQQLIQFGNKVQTKLLELSDPIVDSLDIGLQSTNELIACIQLLDFHEAFYNANNEWAEADRIKWMEYFDQKYQLTDIPFVDQENFVMPETVPLPSNDAVTLAQLNNVKIFLQNQITELQQDIVNLQSLNSLPNEITAIELELNDLYTALNQLSQTLNSLSNTVSTNGSALNSHINNLNIHVSTIDRNNWNNKVSVTQLNQGLSAKANSIHSHSSDQVSYAGNTLTVKLNELTQALTALGTPQKGDTGDSPVLDIAGVNTLNPNEPASVTIDNTNPLNPKLIFNIPRGQGWKPDAISAFANRSNYINEVIGFSFQAVETGMIYFKIGVSGQDIWSNPIRVQGDSGWTPLTRLVIRPQGGYARQLYDYTGGEGNKPSDYIGWYEGLGEYVEDISFSVPATGIQGATPVAGIDFPMPRFKIDNTLTYDAYLSQSATLLITNDSGYTVLINDETNNPDQSGKIWITSLVNNVKTWTGPFKWKGDVGPIGPAGSSLTKSITQADHGLISLNIVTFKDNVFKKYLNGDTPLGLVTKVISPSVFELTQAGYVNNLSGLSPNQIYYIQSNGSIGTTDTGSPILLAISATEGYVLTSVRSAITLNDILSIDNNAGGAEIVNLANGTAAQSAATVGQVNAAEANAKAYTDTKLISALIYCGDWDASTGLYPTTGGTGVAGAIKAGNQFRCSVAGTISGVDYEIGDHIVAKIDTPGQIQANWTDLEGNDQRASESIVGNVAIVTQIVIQDEATTNDSDVVTAKKFWLGLQRFLALSLTWSAQQIFSLAPRFSSVTANHYLKVDGNKDLTSIDKIPVADVSYNENTQSGSIIDFNVQYQERTINNVALTLNDFRNVSLGKSVRLLLTSQNAADTLTIGTLTTGSLTDGTRTVTISNNDNAGSSGGANFIDTSFGFLKEVNNEIYITCTKVTGGYGFRVTINPIV